MPWVGVSVALHALLLLLGWWLSQRSGAKPPLVPMVLSLRPPPIEPPGPVRPLPERGSVRQSRANKDAPAPQASRPPVREETKATPGESMAPRALQGIGEVIARVGPARGAERGLEALEDKPRAFGD